MTSGPSRLLLVRQAQTSLYEHLDAPTVIIVHNLPLHLAIFSSRLTLERRKKKKNRLPIRSRLPSFTSFATDTSLQLVHRVEMVWLFPDSVTHTGPSDETVRRRSRITATALKLLWSQAENNNRRKDNNGLANVLLTAALFSDANES